jgi:hypothetical protein
VYEVGDVAAVLWTIVLVAAVGMPLATASALHRGALSAGLGGRSARLIAAAFALLWLVWLGTAWGLAGAGVFRQSEAAANPWIPVAVLAATAGALALARIPVVATILAQPGTAARLAAPQVWRVVGVAFLVALAVGGLPVLFALPAGLGDVAVGVAAPVIAWRLVRGAGRRGAVWFNVLGVLDLVAAITLAVLTSLGPTRLVAVETSTVEATVLPLALIPTTIVPLALALHVLSLQRLRPTAGVSAPHALLPMS